jgi:hypothetical protein
MSSLFHVVNLNQEEHSEINSLNRYAHTMTLVEKQDFILVYGGVVDSETKKFSIHFSEDILLFSLSKVHKLNL